MPIRVKLPNGEVRVFPDGTTDEEIDAIMAQEGGDRPLTTPDDTDSGAAPTLSLRERLEQQYPGVGKVLDEYEGPRDTPGGLGGVIGGALGGGRRGGIPGAISGAVLGGGGGQAIANLLNGKPVSENVVSEGLTQGAGATVGRVLPPAVIATGNFITRRAVPLVRSGAKQGFEALKRRAGIEGVQPSDVANDQAQFLIDKGLRTTEQADALVKSLGTKIDDVVKTAESDPNVSPVLDTGNRIPQYLNVLLRKIENQIAPGRDRTAVQNFGREIVEDSPLSQSTFRPRAPETLEAGLVRGTREGLTMAENAGRKGPRGPESQFTDVGASYPQSSRPRALRANVRPSEGIAMMRSKSFFDPEASGGNVAAGKTVEKAVRDSVKAAVPETVPLLRDQGRALDARTILDRAAWRDANRDQVGMGGMLGVTGGRSMVGLLLQALKEGQLGAGLAAGKYGPKITRAGQSVDPKLLAAAIQSLLQGAPDER